MKFFSRPEALFLLNLVNNKRIKYTFTPVSKTVIFVKIIFIIKSIHSINRKLDVITQTQTQIQEGSEE